MKSWLQRVIQAIADANEREYGNSVPDCCPKGKPDAKVHPSKRETGKK